MPDKGSKMRTVAMAFIVGIALSLVTALADVLIKHASQKSGFLGWKYLLAASIIYAATAIGWFFVMRKIKLSTLGVLYSVSIVLFLTIISVFYLKEKISSLEIIGIGAALASLALLARFG